ALWCAASPAHANGACAVDRLDLRSGETLLRFSVEVADTVDERALGLMHRTSMPQFSGMLFAYDRPQTVGFWMRNTLIPLDLLFADARGVVQRIHANAVPLSEENIPGGDDIQYVLEINGGLAEMLGLTEGTEFRHPAIDPETAAWPCE
ncbi:MAG: DUF192 domain-containing protein, partial [Pseudomonadota bacterium]